jgi:adenylate cyclase
MVRRAKPALFALLAHLPLLSAVGFFRMMQTVVAMHAMLPAPDPKLVAHQLTLDAWRHNLIVLYLWLVISAFAAGQMRNWFDRRRMRDPLR